MPQLFEQAVEFCARARKARPDVTFGADLIAGFPTETDAQFQRSLDLIEACGLTWLHVFPYSARTGTPAARMPQVPPATRKARAARLRATGDGALGRFLQSRIGGDERVLVNSAGDWGHSDPLAVPKCHVELLRRGHSPKMLDKVSFQNPKTFLGQSPKFHVEDE